MLSVLDVVDKNSICEFCGCPYDLHEARIHEVERGDVYCRGCNSIHDYKIVEIDQEGKNDRWMKRSNR